jgi:hypothetical protein
VPAPQIPAIRDPAFRQLLDAWTKRVAAPQPVVLPKVQLNAHELKPAVSNPAFQQRLDALAERVAAMETKIKLLK